MSKTHNGVIKEAEKIAGVADDYRQRLSQIIEEEGNRIRKEAEKESSHIITKAREEYKERLSRG